MTTVLLAIAVFMLAAGGLGLGAWLKDRPIQGSCGGLACLKKLGAGCAGGCLDKEKSHG
ncbi:MAG TPA: hypothetical protein VIN57_02930 [Magnetovibrio sp.]